MAKKQDFLSKTMKGIKHGAICPKCESQLSYVKVVNTEKSDKTSAWRFVQKQVAVCKCNEQKIFS
jgi:hypothetical protein